METVQITWQWLKSQKEAQICAAIAWHGSRMALINHLLHHVDTRRYKDLQILSNQSLVVLIGNKVLLPWVDGIQYVGYDEKEPRLWRPAHKQPSVDATLLANALCQYYQQTTLLIWDNPKVIIPLNKAQIVDSYLLNTIAAQYDKSV